MTTDCQWQEMEKQDLLMLAKNFAGQKTSISDIQRYARWGYNRSQRMVEMAVECGFATRVSELGGMVVTWPDTVHCQGDISNQQKRDDAVSYVNPERSKD